MPTDENNPFTAEQVCLNIRATYGDRDDVVVSIIPDIESVNYGRGVGYEVNEWQPPAKVAEISGTAIRAALRTEPPT